MSDMTTVVHASDVERTLQRLAHAIEVIDSPEPLFPLLGLVSVSLESFHQVLDELADWYIENAEYARSIPFPIEAGPGRAMQVAAELQEAAQLIEKAATGVDCALARHRSLTWQPATEARHERAERISSPSSFGKHTATATRPHALRRPLQ